MRSWSMIWACWVVLGCGGGGLPEAERAAEAAPEETEGGSQTRSPRRATVDLGDDDITGAVGEDAQPEGGGQSTVVEADRHADLLATALSASATRTFSFSVETRGLPSIDGTLPSGDHECRFDALSETGGRQHLNVHCDIDGARVLLDRFSYALDAEGLSMTRSLGFGGESVQVLPRRLRPIDEQTRSSHGTPTAWRVSQHGATWCGVRARPNEAHPVYTEARAICIDPQGIVSVGYRTYSRSEGVQVMHAHRRGHAYSARPSYLFD